jgi:hypothetical protein
VTFFIREASKRGYTREDIIALLDERGMTVEAAVEQILLDREPKVAQKPNQAAEKELVFSAARQCAFLRCPLDAHSRMRDSTFCWTQQSTPKKARFLKAYSITCQITKAAEMAGIDRGTHTTG